MRVHLAGSASQACDEGILRVAHLFIESIVDSILKRGGGLVLGVADEPRANCDYPCIFDWTALEAVAASRSSVTPWPAVRPAQIVVVGSQRGLQKIPECRVSTWKECRVRGNFELKLMPPGWRMGELIRESQVLSGDVLVVLGGGAGVERLADLYRDEGKPVVPIHADLGAFSNDGNGGSCFLHDCALADTRAYFRLRDSVGSATARLSALRLTADSDAGALASIVVQLLEDLRPRSAFYVRLLNTHHADYVEVESFFRSIVDAVVTERGFTPHEMGRARPDAAFINVELFEILHRAGLVVVDITGVRPDCMMELGYALARRRRVVISAKMGTTLPFDGDKLPTYFWENRGALDERVHAYSDWFDRYSDLPNIVN